MQQPPLSYLQHADFSSQYNFQHARLGRAPSLIKNNE